MGQAIGLAVGAGVGQFQRNQELKVERQQALVEAAKTRAAPLFALLTKQRIDPGASFDPRGANQRPLQGAAAGAKFQSDNPDLFGKSSKQKKEEAKLQESSDAKQLQLQQQDAARNQPVIFEDVDEGRNPFSR